MSLFPNDASKPSVFGSSSTSNNATSQSQTHSSIFGLPQQQINHPVNQVHHSSIQGSTIFGGTCQPNQSRIGLVNPVQGQHALGSHSLSSSQHQSVLQPMQHPLSWQSGSTLSLREKTVPEQMQVLLEKWSPESADCAFQRYFYNDVDASSVPFYGPAVGEDEQKWEEALSNKPGENAVPVLCRGFAALGNRLHVQVQSVTALQSRLHEINNSLAEILQRHNGRISVRAADARRRHIALSQRCLQIATKVQILRNRGYAMDGPEEHLKKTLSDLERGVFDPQLNSRQDEIWARMVGVRERIHFLREQLQKAPHSPENQNDIFDDRILRTTRKILDDYDCQILHLQREISAIGNDLEGAIKRETSVQTELHR